MQVRVPGFDFIGCGEARNKKDAQGLAAQLFCQFLVQSNLVDGASLPATIPEETQSSLPSANPTPPSVAQESSAPLLSLLPVAKQPEAPNSHPPVSLSTQPGPSQSDARAVSSQSDGGAFINTI